MAGVALHLLVGVSLGFTMQQMWITSTSPTVGGHTLCHKHLKVSGYKRVYKGCGIGCHTCWLYFFPVLFAAALVNNCHLNKLMHYLEGVRVGSLCMLAGTHPPMWLAHMAQATNPPMCLAHMAHATHPPCAWQMALLAPKPTKKCPPEKTYIKNKQTKYSRNMKAPKRA